MQEILNPPVSPEMEAVIKARLDGVEHEEDIRILFAIESGSRAWGFHSTDSDYDVRFVYARPTEWHYRLGKKRDVVERPIDDELDISGWELSKALGLAVGSNAVIAEWLQSPIVYRADHTAVAALEAFARKALDRKSVTWHYVSLFERQAKRLAHPEGGIRIKRLFYILRPALALRWMRIAQQAVPPMNLALLRDGCDLDPSVSASIDTLLELKLQAKEKGTIDRIDPVITDLVERERELARDWLAASPKSAHKGLWDEASSLHRKISQRSFSSVTTDRSKF